MKAENGIGTLLKERSFGEESVEIGIDLRRDFLGALLSLSQRSTYSASVTSWTLVTAFQVSGGNPAGSWGCHSNQRLSFFILTVYGVVGKGTFSLEQTWRFWGPWSIVINTTILRLITSTLKIIALRALRSFLGFLNKNLFTLFTEIVETSSSRFRIIDAS